MNNEIVNLINDKMDKSIKVFKEELHSIRAGKANSALLDRIHVEYYGSDTPLKQIAGISIPEPRVITIQPYDTSAMDSIIKAIQVSDLGINPSSDGKIIRLVLPILTEERRKDLVKQVKKLAENTKVAIRNERREANEKLKKMQKNSEITEDELKAFELDVQKKTDKHIETIDQIVKDKEAEIMEV
jgi:ribosome recycling factor